MIFPQRVKIKRNGVEYVRADIYDRVLTQRDELLKALENLVSNQEEGWRSTKMPEDHINKMPYLKESRVAITKAKG